MERSSLYGFASGYLPKSLLFTRSCGRFLVKILITIRQRRLEMSKVILRPLWVKSEPIAQIKNIRATGQFDTVFSQRAALRYSGLVGGNVAFQAEGTTYGFGIGLDERDSMAIAEVCRQEISR
jgi:hypothetical protein